LIVVDTNVVTSLLLQGPKTALAVGEAFSAREALLERHPQWAAPPLWRSEFRYVLTGYLQQADDLLAAHDEPARSEPVLELMSTSRCSSYDCEFVAAAQHLGVPLVTEDRDLLVAFKAVAQSLHQATS
jgi:predicted nucleic acid-binding protein